MKTKHFFLDEEADKEGHIKSDLERTAEIDIVDLS